MLQSHEDGAAEDDAEAAQGAQNDREDIGEDQIMEDERTTFQEIALEFPKLTAMERPHSDCCDYKTLMRHLMAVAQASEDAQTRALESTLRYVNSMHMGGHFRALVVAFSTHFDESPLKLRVAFPSGRGEAQDDLQLGKIVVVQTSWNILVQDLRRFDDDEFPDGSPRFLMLHGQMSPQVRACDRGNGEGLAAVLLSCSRWKAKLAENIPMQVSVFEADSLGANDRAIDLTRCKAPASALLHLRCLCHRVHTSAKKTFDLRPDLLTGITRCLLVLAQ